MEILYLAFAATAAIFLTLFAFMRRYKRCPSDKILVVYGKISARGSGGLSAKCTHGGAAFIWPVLQDYAFLDLKPLTIDIKLEGALSRQNIRVNTPATFTVGISTEPGVMQNAAERLLGMEMRQIAELARDIIFGQMRVVLATMPIEEINADRDKLIENIFSGVEVELKKVGLRLINVNIQDITDESGYIDALGKEAAARAINEAKVRVSEQERDGAIGSAQADRDRRVQVASAEATATEGENTAKITVARSNALRREQEAEAERAASAAEKTKAAQALEESYQAEEAAERRRAQREEATQNANILVPAEIKKREVEILAEAEAEKTRRLKKGEADGLLSVMEAEADGIRAILSRKALGFEKLVDAAEGRAQLAALLMVTEQMPKLVEEQVKAISNLKIDKVTVWDGGRGANGKTATSDFLSGLVGSLPPLHELTKNVGIELPEVLGRTSDSEPKPVRRQAKVPAAVAELRKWMGEQIGMFKALDTNRDGKVDQQELERASAFALDWAKKTENGEDLWLYADGSKWVGPVSWAEIVERGTKQKWMPVQAQGDKIWLPFDAVVEARRLMAKEE